MQEFVASIPQDRNSCLDACRLFTSIAILWMHSWESGHIGDVGEIGRFGVPFFTISATYLLMQSFHRRPDRPFLPYVRNRFARLYLPFLMWGTLGLSLMFLKHHFISHQPMPPIGLYIFLNGASFQLWFLPFLLIVSLLSFPVCSFGVKVGRPAQIMLAILLIFGSAAAIWAPRFRSVAADTPNFEYYLFYSFSMDALPSAFLGLSLGLLLKERTIASWAGWFGIIIAVAGTAIVTASHRDRVLETIAGMGLLIFAISGKDSAVTRQLSKLSFLAYGIYLSQNVVLEPIQAVLSRIGVHASCVVESGVFVAALAGTVSLSLILHRSDKTRWMLG